jgi:hypothetical protein
MLKTVKGTVNKQMHTTGGYLMLKTVGGAVKIKYLRCPSVVYDNGRCYSFKHNASSSSLC